MKKHFNRFWLFILLFTFQLYGQLKFAWITDTHIGSTGSEDDLLSIVKNINQQEIKFTIITGDVTEKGLSNELETAKDILSNLNKPYFIIPGNHDTKWSESGCTKFREVFGDDRFLFHYEDYCFIGLNSGIPHRGGGGHISVDDLNWLKAKLSRIDKNAKIILAIHHQLTSEIDNYKEVLSLFNEFAKVFVIVGHGHSNRIYNFSGIKGAMGRSALSRGLNPGYNIVELYEDSIKISTDEISEIKEWYKNSLLKNNSTNIDIPHSRTCEDFIKIFDSQSTIVKTGITDGSKLYFSDLKGYIYSINLNGKILWKRYFPTSFFAKPILFNNLLIVSGTDGNIYFLNKRNGDIKSILKLKASVVATPVINKNYLIVLSNDGKINYIELKKFTLTSYDVAGKNFEANPLLYDNKLIIGNWDAYFYCLSTSPLDTPIIKWKWTENRNFYYSPAACTPIIDYLNRIVISTPDKFISLVDFLTGQTKYRTNEFNNWESIGIDKSKKVLIIKSLIDTVYAVDLCNNPPKILWKTSLNYGLDTNPIPVFVSMNKVFIPAKNGYLYVLNLKDGSLIDSFYTGSARLNDVIEVRNNTFIFSNMDGKIFKLKISD